MWLNFLRAKIVSLQQLKSRFFRLHDIYSFSWSIFFVYSTIGLEFCLGLHSSFKHIYSELFFCQFHLYYRKERNGYISCWYFFPFPSSFSFLRHSPLSRAVLVAVCQTSLIILFIYLEIRNLKGLLESCVSYLNTFGTTLLFFQCSFYY